MSEYEVRCSQCRVSFPLGTRRCMYCGEKIGQSAAAPELASLPSEEGEEETSSGRSALRVGSGVVWVLLALFGSLYRVCMG